MSAEPEGGRTLERFGALCDRAAPYGLARRPEFAVYTGVRTLAQAARRRGLIEAGECLRACWMPCTSAGRAVSPLISARSLRRCSSTRRSVMPVPTCPAPPIRPRSSAKRARAASCRARASCPGRAAVAALPDGMPPRWKRRAGIPPISPRSSAPVARTARSRPCCKPRSSDHRGGRMLKPGDKAPDFTGPRSQRQRP